MASPPPRRRSRSPRPGRDGDPERRRDRHAADRDEDRSRTKKRTGGFNFKDKRRDDEPDGRDDRAHDRHQGSSFRGYRNRSPSPRRRDRDRDRDRDAERQRGARGPEAPPPSSGKKQKPDTTKPPTRAAPAPSSTARSAPQEEMIIVHVNDRLGTKAAIPCLPSDTIREFKMIVAARIGRETHEILLKRQGQRPFKDMLTLADYEISNGVQLDLEVDTGD